VNERGIRHPSILPEFTLKEAVSSRYHFLRNLTRRFQPVPGGTLKPRLSHGDVGSSYRDPSKAEEHAALVQRRDIVEKHAARVQIQEAFSFAQTGEVPSETLPDPLAQGQESTSYNLYVSSDSTPMTITLGKFFPTIPQGMTRS
jgi:hypothetical protein